MTYTIIILVIVFILFRFFKINKSDNSLQIDSTNEMYEDNNYQALKKMFFYPNGHNINFVNIKRPNIVIGIMIEQSIKGDFDDINENHPFLTKRNKKILFASYITGFVGFYYNYGGGFIKGKSYKENSDIQQELMELYYNSSLDGVGQDMKTQRLATRLVLKSNKLINHTVKDNNDTNWNLESEKIKIWLRTNDGIYFAEEIKSNINKSIWKEIIENSHTILKLLEREKNILDNRSWVS